ncbi:MAG: hypothetical protein EXS12_04835 [Phycisphaerales bacterium]|nr:hypothetical protein [Phycisphaerales bacterium]
MLLPHAWPHLLFALADSAVLAWGNNGQGQCNVPASATSDVSAIAGGYYHTIALSPDFDSDGIPNATDNCPSVANPTQADCDGNGVGDACELDCNSNSIHDSCEILSGAVTDINGNYIPDSCDAGSGVLNDYNNNGIADSVALITVTVQLAALTAQLNCGDLSGDGIVVNVDLGIVRVAVSYGNCTGCPEDVNNDGAVNEGDLMLVQNAIGCDTSGVIPDRVGDRKPYTYNYAAFEASREITQFSSQYDSSMHAVPPSNKYTFTASQENGRALYFGKAKCSQYHSSANDSELTTATNGKDVFTMFCYANLGVPKNIANPFYKMTDPSNPGYNTQGANYVDYGLGGFLYLKQGLPIGNVGPGSNGRGDFIAVNGVFLSPTIRNADKRPYPAFVKITCTTACVKV